MAMMTMIIITKMMLIIGSLNNDDVEDNENAEKANRFSLPNFFKKIFASVDNALLYISLVSFHDLPNFTFLDKCFYFFQLRYSPLEFNTRKIHQHLTNRDLEKERWILNQLELTF